jgi:hypothetical protein
MRIIIEHLKVKVFEPLKWIVTAEESIEPFRVVKLTVDTGSKILKIWVEYKPALLGAIAKEGKEVDIVVLGTKYMSKPMLEQFKAQGISVIDEAGNYFFSYQRGKERVWLYEFGHKPETLRPPRIDAFSPKACFVAMALLHAPDFSIPTMRDLKEKTGVSLGGLNTICKAMKTRGLITYSHSEPIQVANPTRFLDEFASYYKVRLAPKLMRKGYIAAKKKIVDKESKEVVIERVHWREAAAVLQEALPNMVLTGVQAAQSESTYYAIDIGEILIDDIKTAELILRRHFLTAPTEHRADFYLVVPYNHSAFMYPNDEEQMRRANRIQIYLDLMSSDDQRANELGAIYREKAIGY